LNSDQTANLFQQKRIMELNQLSSQIIKADKYTEALLKDGITGIINTPSQ
jgi:hypothetical protein